jgi:hypothetical protein
MRLVFTDAQSNRISLPGVLMYGSLPLRRQFWIVPTEQFNRRESSLVSMNPSGAPGGDSLTISVVMPVAALGGAASICAFIGAITAPMHRQLGDNQMPSPVSQNQVK